MFLLNVFLESLHAATIIPFASGATLAAMKAFGHDITLPVGVALVAATLGHTFNWWVGHSLLKQAQRRQQIQQSAGYLKTRNFFHRYLFWLLLISWMPLFTFFSVAAGFLGLPARRFLPLVLTGQALYFGAMLLR